MHSATVFAVLASLLTASAFPLEDALLDKRATCSSYVLINARGTGESQGPSAGFTTMNSNVQRQVPGGSVYNVVYPAGFGQDSSAGTTDIVNQVNNGVKANPSQCFILEGYSQGAAAVVDAMPKLTGASFSAVKGVVLLGNPEHKAGLACNVDQVGGTSTKNVNGLSSYKAGIPSNWVSKTLDICWKGDGVCDTQDGFGITVQHLQYPGDAGVQNMGTSYIVKALQS